LQYFAAVGINATFDAVGRGVYEEHYNSNQIEAAWWGGDRTTLPLLAPDIFLGVVLDRPWAVAWGAWWHDPASWIAEAPPQGHWIRDIWAIWDQVAVEVDPLEQTRLFRQILDIWARELPMIGFLGEFPAPVIVKNGLRNYVAGYPIDDTTNDEHLLNPETLFWDEPSPMLLSNFATGKPGSYFSLSAVNFPPNQSATVSVNHVFVDTVTIDSQGSIEMILDTNALPAGDYLVRVSVNPHASAPLILADDQPLRTKEGDGKSIIIPETVAEQRLYLPMIER
jgi:hypothetical protein